MDYSQRVLYILFLFNQNVLRILVRVGDGEEDRALGVGVATKRERQKKLLKLILQNQKLTLYLLTFFMTVDLITFKMMYNTLSIPHPILGTNSKILC